MLSTKATLKNYVFKMENNFLSVAREEGDINLIIKLMK